MLRIYVDCRSLAPETSEGNNTNQARDFSCDILAKKLAAFCPYTKNLPETKFKSNGSFIW